MKIEIKKFDDSLEAVWDQFVECESLNGTFLHSRKFFRHNALNAKDDNSYLFYKKNKIAAVIPFNRIITENKITLNSFLRATYGGFIVSAEIGVEEAVEMVTLVIEEAKKINVTEIIIRNPFHFLQKTWCDETDYAMWLQGFKIKYRELEAVITLNNDVSERYQNGAKYNIKKAWKTVTVKEGDFYEQFWEMLTDNLMQKYGTKPTHQLDEFLFLRELVGTGKINLFGGFIDDKLVCGVVVFLFYPEAIHAQYIASDINYQDARPLNAVIDYIIHWGKERSYKYFNLGMANEDAGKKINYGLFHFKEGFGARGVLRETMHLMLNKE
jgi:hypothetical protein